MSSLARGSQWRVSVPTRRHEELLELLRQDPRIVVEWLERSGLVEIPAFTEIEVRPGEIRELLPTERRADLVILLSDGEPVLVFVVEVQKKRRADKRRTWPVYLTNIRAEYHCPAVLIVFALTPSVIAWAKEPISLGHPGFELRPIVVGPSDLPRVTDAAEARRAPYRAILSALVHAKDEGAEHEVLAALRAADTLNESDADAWREMLLFAVNSNEVARKALEAIMDLQSFRRVSVWFKEGREEGRMEGRREAARGLLMRLLEKRGFVLGPEDHARIAACEDVQALERWCEQAVDAETLGDALRLREPPRKPNDHLAVRVARSNRQIVSRYTASDIDTESPRHAITRNAPRLPKRRRSTTARPIIMPVVATRSSSRPVPKSDDVKAWVQPPKKSQWWARRNFRNIA